MNGTRLITMIEGAIIAGVCVALSYIPLNTANAGFDLSLGLIPLGVFALRRGLLPGMAVGLVWGLLLIVLGRAYILTIPQAVLEYPVAFALGGFGGVFSGRLHRTFERTAGTRTVGTCQRGRSRVSGDGLICVSGDGLICHIKNVTNQTVPADTNQTVPADTRPSPLTRPYCARPYCARGAVQTVVFAAVVSAAARWFAHFWAGVIFWGSYAPEGMSPYVYSFIFNGSSAAANAALTAIVLTVLLRNARVLFTPRAQ